MEKPKRPRGVLSCVSPLIVALALAACNGDDIHSLVTAQGGASCVIPSGTPAPFTVSFFDRGWWGQAGSHDSTLQLATTGWVVNAETRAYAQWDLSAVPGQVQSANLRLAVDTYTSADLSESVSLWQVTTSSTVLDTTSSTNVAVFTDLADGPQYGAFSVVPTNVGKTVLVPLSPAAVCDMNAAAGGTFAIGMTVDSLARVAMSNEIVRFGDIASEVNNLELQVVP